jgi:acyl-CoA dehydrogenase
MTLTAALLRESPLSSSPAIRIDAVRRIAADIAGPAAAAVDRDARFPAEAMEALGKARMLSAHAPVAYGGFGASIGELAQMCEALGARCASTAMIFAMHQIQVACVVRHGAGSRFFRSYVAELVDAQSLIASVTSEAGVGGSTRTSISPIERLDGGRCRLRKDGTVVSYGDHADALLITVRRAADAAAGDQALVLARRSQCTMEKTGTWDTFGMRGTCSPGYVVTAEVPEEQIVPAPFAEISSQTMVPYAHILWSACWSGIASDAVARARAFVRSVARQMPGTTPPAAARLAEASTLLEVMRAHVRDAARTYDEIVSRRDGGASELSTVGFALRLNDLKLASSNHVANIVTRALRVCGTAGYRNDSPYSLTRHLRDAHSAALMIGNERINAANANLHLIYKDDA